MFKSKFIADHVWLVAPPRTPSRPSALAMLADPPPTMLTAKAGPDQAAEERFGFRVSMPGLSRLPSNTEF